MAGLWDQFAGPLSEGEHCLLLARIDAVTKMVEAGKITRCAAFAYLMGFLFHLCKQNALVRGDDSAGPATAFMAIYYFCSDKYVLHDMRSTFCSLGFNVDDPTSPRFIMLPKEVPWRSGWKAPAWLKSHGGKDRKKGEVPQGNETGYIQWDDDVTGRHDHFVANLSLILTARNVPGIGDPVVNVMMSTEDGSKTDEFVNAKGRELARQIARFANGAAFGRWIFSTLCDESRAKCSCRGPLDENTVKGLLNQLPR